MWELDHKESWALKNWCFWTVVLEKTLESPLDYKEMKPVSRKGDQSWIFIGRTDAEAATPVLWPPNAKSWLTGKDPDAGKDCRWGEWLDGIWSVTLNIMLLECSEDRGWDGWMVPLTRWTWVWASSRSRCWTGKPGVLQAMRSLRVEHDGATQLNWGPTSRFSAGDQANRQVIPRDSDFESQWDLIIEIPWDWGKQETLLLEGTNKTVCPPGPRGRSSKPTGNWVRLALSVSGSPTEGKGWQWPAMGKGVLVAVLGDASWCKFS